MLSLVCDAGFTMDEAMAIHPDGTPVNPLAMREALRQDRVDGDPSVWKADATLMELVHGEDLNAFIDYMQQINSDRIFNPDGSAQDIEEWRQSVRDDEQYGMLLQNAYPDVYHLVIHGTDEQVQDMLRAQRRVQAAAARSSRHDESEL